MLPCPLSCALVGLCDISVLVNLTIYESNVSVISLGLLVHKSKYSLCSRKSHNDRVYLLRKLVYVSCKLLCHVEEGNDYIDCKSESEHASCCEKTAEAEVAHSACDKQTANGCTNNVEHVADIHYDRSEAVGKCVCLKSVLEKLVVDLIEILLDLILVAEYLDDLLTVHHFLNEALGLTDGFLLTDKVLRRAAAYVFGNKDHCYNTEKYYKRHGNAEPEHYEENCRNDNSCLHKAGKGLRNKLTESVYIIGIVAHYIAVLVSVEILYRKTLHLVKHLTTHLGKKALGNIRHKLRVNGYRDDRKSVENYESDDHRHDLCSSRFPAEIACIEVAFNGSEYLLCEYGGNSRNYCREYNAARCDRDKNGVSLDKRFNNSSKYVFVKLTLGRMSRHLIHFFFTHYRHLR